MENLGVLTALGAALAWGSYMVPFKKSQSENLGQFQAVMGIGILVSGLVFAMLAGFSLQLNLYGLLSGILWGCANAISLTAVLNLGISRALPLLGSLVILSTFLWGVLIFNELPQGITVGFMGIALIITGVTLVSTTGNTQSQNIKKGLVATVLAGLIFGSQLVPIKVGHVQTAQFFFSTCLGIFLTALVIAAISRVKFSKEALGMSLLSGVIWNVGNLLSLISISLIGLSKAIPVSQSSTLMAVLWGLFYFKEITSAKRKLQVLVGAIILFLGIIVLGSA